MDKKKHPTLNIGGTFFSVDIANHSIYTTSNPDNCLSLRGLCGSDSNYHFYIDPATKEISSFAEDLPGVQLPRLSLLYPAEFKEHYGIPKELKLFFDDRLAMFQRPEVDERLKGKLPILEIAGKEYTVDFTFQHIIAPDGIHWSLEFDPFMFDDIVVDVLHIDGIPFDHIKNYAESDRPEERLHNIVLLDNSTGKSVLPAEYGKMLNKDQIVFAVIPPVNVLDPIGYAYINNRKVGEQMLGTQYNPRVTARILNHQEVKKHLQCNSNIFEDTGKQKKRKKGRRL